MPCCAHTGCQPQAMPQFPPVAQGQGSLEGLGVSFPLPHLSVCPRGVCVGGIPHTPNPPCVAREPSPSPRRPAPFPWQPRRHPSTLPSGYSDPRRGDTEGGGGTHQAPPLPPPIPPALGRFCPLPAPTAGCSTPAFGGHNPISILLPGKLRLEGGGTPPPRTPLPSTPALMQAAMGWALPSPASAAVPGTYPAGEGEESGWGGGGRLFGKKRQEQKK